jgi:hypothetical protein
VARRDVRKGRTSDHTVPPRKRSRRAILAIAPAAIGLTALAIAEEPAGAATVSRNEQVDVGGGTTCFITITQEFPVGGNAQLARAKTEVTGGSGPGADNCIVSGTAFVSAQYLDPDGHTITMPTNDDGTFDVERYYAPVGSDLSTFHRVFFQFCTCSSPTYQLV